MIVRDCIQGSPEWHRARLGVVTASEVSRIFTSGGEPRREKHYAATEKAPEGVDRAPKQSIALSLLRGAEGWPLPASDLPSASVMAALVEKGWAVEVDNPEAPEIWDGPGLSSGRADYLHQLLGEWVCGTPDETFQGNYWTERGHEMEAQCADTFRFTRDAEPEPVGFILRGEGEDAFYGCSPDWVVRDGGEIVEGVEVKSPSRPKHVGYLLSGSVPLQYQAQVQYSLWVTRLPRWSFVSYYPGLPPVVITVEPHPLWTAAFDTHLPAFADEFKAGCVRLVELGVRPALERAA